MMLWLNSGKTIIHQNEDKKMCYYKPYIFNTDKHKINVRIVLRNFQIKF